jgi:apolipoprotein N-acyltransferase
MARTGLSAILMMRPPTLLGAVVATATTALAFAFYARVAWPWAALGWIGLVPWLAALDGATSWRGALALGLLMSEAFVLVVFSWFPTAVQNYTGAPFPVALLVTVLAAPLLEAQFVTFAVGRHVARSTALWRTALTGACVYVGTEWAYPKLFADTLGHGLYASAWMRQAADLGGAHGLTLVLIIANECAWATVRAWFVDGTERLPWRAPATVVGALVLALLGYGALRYRQLNASTQRRAPVTAAVVQANISHYGRLATELGTFEATRLILDTHFALSATAFEPVRPDFLVWPETVYPTTFGTPKSEDGAAFDREIERFVAHTGVPLVFGTYDAEGGEEFNAAAFLNPDSDRRLALDTYRKAALFPLTERVPALLDVALVRYWLPWLGTWKPGAGARVVPLSLRDGRALRVVPLICYDALDPDLAIAAVRQGGDLIVTLSNDSWFSYGNVPRLILIISAFRSLETRRAQVRATNTGISAMISATGDVLGTVGSDERGTLVRSLDTLGEAQTLMLAWGNWLGPAALACGALLLASQVSGRVRLRHRNVPASAVGSRSNHRRERQLSAGSIDRAS